MIDPTGGKVSETMRVRDHNQLCEHGSLTPHWITSGKGRWWKEPECYGGREIVLRRDDDGHWMEVGEKTGDDE